MKKTKKSYFKQNFVTHIYKAPLSARPSSLIKVLEPDIDSLLASDKKGYEWSKKNYPGGYTSYGSQDQLQLVMPGFKELEKKLTSHLKAFIEKLQYDINPAQDLKMTHCWLNVMSKNTLHASHIHPQSVISGTFYVQVPPKASAIKFEDPRLGLFMNSPLPHEKADFINQRFISFKPKNFEVILFESWLRHEVPENKSLDPRISISFNYGWCK